MRGNSMSDQDIAAQEAIANEWLARNDANVALVEKQAAQYINEESWSLQDERDREIQQRDYMREEMLRIDEEDREAEYIKDWQEEECEREMKRYEDRLEEEKENNQAVLEKEEDILSKDWDIEWEIDREKEMNGEGKDFDIFDYLIHDEQFKADICAEIQAEE